MAATNKTTTPVRFDVISIGTLSRNRLWNEQEAVRTAHATTTLIRAGGRRILVDPGLPGPALAARLFERTGLRPEQVDAIFLTNFRPAHRGGLGLFAGAPVYLHDAERDAARSFLERLSAEAPEEDLDRRVMEADLRLLDRVRSPEDQLADAVDLFPSPGYTPGTCGLLLALPTHTVLVAGDAVPTLDHFLAGQILPDAYDIQAAHTSLREIYEIADVIVPGHDNVFWSPRSHGL